MKIGLTEARIQVSLMLNNYLLYFFKDIYCTGSIYSVYKDKLQNCSCDESE
jgi:hypothetical protein